VAVRKELPHARIQHSTTVLDRTVFSIVYTAATAVEADYR